VHFGDGKKLLMISDIAVTLTFDLLISKSNQFIFVPNCTKNLNLMRFQ